MYIFKGKLIEYCCIFVPAFVPVYLNKYSNSFCPQLPQDSLASETLRSALLYQQPQNLIQSPLQSDMDCDINNPLQVGAFNTLPGLFDWSMLSCWGYKVQSKFKNLSFSNIFMFKFMSVQCWHTELATGDRSVNSYNCTSLLVKLYYRQRTS